MESYIFVALKPGFNVYYNNTLFMVHRIRISRKKRCYEDDVCHNRWHPDIPPILSIKPGDIVELEMRDALDYQVRDEPGVEDLKNMELGVAHPLTGPIYVEGAKPGDLLKVEVLDIKTESFGYSAIIPGFGFLREKFDVYFKARWHIERGVARSPEIPGVKIPGDPFLGVMGVAPSHELMKVIMEREARLYREGKAVMLPDPNGAAPPREPIASEGLRTIPPRENGGNMDVREMSVGSKIYFPVFVEGALFSAGDMHFAQGDGEVCGMAIETGGTATLKIDLIKDGARRYNVKSPIYVPSSNSIHRFNRYIVATGHGVNWDVYDGENINLSAKSALNNIFQILEKMGYNKMQAYILFSVAGDLRISQAVDVPNLTVSAFIPLDIFDNPPEFFD